MSQLNQTEQSLEDDKPDVICLSHLRWNFVYQRPQQLMSRCAQDWRVFYIEEPIFEESDEITPWLELDSPEQNVWVAVPHLPQGLSEEESHTIQRNLIDNLRAGYAINSYLLWYYTPMAIPFTDHLQKPTAVVYDCMDELSAFKDAPPLLHEREKELFRRADLVFTGGVSLFEVKRRQHPNVYPFPSSIDTAHFGKAKTLTDEPADQSTIPHPRLGFFGVIDERLDIDLLAGLAAERPDWHLVIIGPVVKIDPALLPRPANIHYLGMKAYKELPAYLAGWDVALLPFAINDATRYISPTKTPEYLAGGKPVVSTPIRDVIYPYGEEGMVHIATTVPEFVESVTKALQKGVSQSWLDQVNAFLAQNSWDQTWLHMRRLIENEMGAAMISEATPESLREQSYVGQ